MFKGYHKIFVADVKLLCIMPYKYICRFLEPASGDVVSLMVVINFAFINADILAVQFFASDFFNF